jgi:hypothetical protein
MLTHHVGGRCEAYGKAVNAELRGLGFFVATENASAALKAPIRSGLGVRNSCDFITLRKGALCLRSSTTK